MPIRPENRGRYPDNWAEISDRIRFERAKGRCECTGQCGKRHPFTTDGRCSRKHGRPTPSGKWRTILTTAHLDHIPENCDDDNLLAMCQGCHLRYDAAHHAETARRTRRREEANDGHLDAQMHEETHDDQAT